MGGVGSLSYEGDSAMGGLVAGGGVDVAVAAEIDVGAGLAGVAVGLAAAVPGKRHVAGVEDHHPVPVVDPQLIVQDALHEGDETVVVFSVGGEDVGEEEGDAFEGDASDNGVEAGGGEGFHHEFDGVAHIGGYLKGGVLVVVVLLDAVDIPATHGSAAPVGSLAVATDVFDGEFHVVVGEYFWTYSQQTFDGLDGVDGDAATAGA